MDFSGWLIKEEDQKLDAKRVQYVGCVLNKVSQKYLINEVQKWLIESRGTGIPAGWIVRGHHMTVKFKPSQPDIDALEKQFGDEINISATNLAYDDYGIAVMVRPHTNLAVNNNNIPHITIAHSKDVGAVYSNTLLLSKKNYSPVNKSLPLVSYLVAIMSSGYYPALEALASDPF